MLSRAGKATYTVSSVEHVNKSLPGEALMIGLRDCSRRISLQVQLTFTNSKATSGIAKTCKKHKTEG